MTFHQSCRDAGVDVTLDNFPGQFHVFQTFGVFVPEARAALAKVGAFFREN
jgi:acetyl esterase/lipase